MIRFEVYDGHWEVTNIHTQFTVDGGFFIGCKLFFRWDGSDAGMDYGATSMSDFLYAMMIVAPLDKGELTT